MRYLLIVLVFAVNVFGQADVADLIIVNANVRTLSEKQPRAEAIAISGGKIIAVGSTKTIRGLTGKETKVIDAGGKLVLPGFNDAHVHFAAIGNTFSSIPLKDLRSPREFSERLAYYARFLPKGRWILGSGWDNRSWVPNDPLRLEMANAVTPVNPLFVYNWDATAAFANSRALELAGITKESKDPPGGTIIRDAAGEPTGVLRGTAMRLVGRLVPANHMRDLPAIIETASNYAASLGVTSVTDVHSDDLSAVLRELDRQGKLKTRVYDCVPLDQWTRLEQAGVKAATGDAMVRSGCLKYYVEEDDVDIEKLESDITAADRAGLQVAIHAIGPRPNEIVLNAFEKAITANGARDRRFRVEHAHDARPEDLLRFAKLGVIASMQPWLFYGPNGNRSDPYKKIFEHRTQVAFGSDASITDFDPLLAIHAAVNGKNGISVEQAVRAHTIGSAYAEFQEDVKGTIEVGKLADFVILSEDIFQIDTSKLRGVKVETTVLAGSLIYQSK